MKIESLIDKITVLISEGKVYEACDNLWMVLNRESESFIIVNILKSELSNLLRDDLLGIINHEQKKLQINGITSRLHRLTTVLSDSDFDRKLNINQSKEAILEELLNMKGEYEFDSKRLEAIHSDRVLDLKENIKRLKQELRDQLEKQKSQNNKLVNKINETQIKNNELETTIKSLKNKMKEIEKDRRRLKNIINSEYSRKKIWSDKNQI